MRQTSSGRRLMTEQEWLQSVDGDCLGRFRNLEGTPGIDLSDRKLWLYAAACARRIWHYFEDLRARTAIEATERFADGLATRREFLSASRDAEKAVAEIENNGRTDRPGGADWPAI